MDKFKKKIQEQAKENQSLGGGDKKSEDFKKSVTQNFVEAKNNRSDNETNAKLAKMAGVGLGTIARYDTVMKSDDE